MPLTVKLEKEIEKHKNELQTLRQKEIMRISTMYTCNDSFKFDVPIEIMLVALIGELKVDEELQKHYKRKQIHFKKGNSTNTFTFNHISRKHLKLRPISTCNLSQ
jgi:hypothetical protein